ncbi:MAG TPA: hypothetical protein VFE52_10685, partial [Devosia sp.]|nr:hypothetical protein [Devosia sp.]
MNKLALVAAAALSAATFGVAAIAQESDTTQAGDFDNVDANKDQLVSWDEAVGVYPTLTQDLFNQADANGDGSLDEAEFISLEGLTAGLDDDGTEDTQENDSSSQSSAEDNDGGDDNQDTDDNEDDDDEISDEDSS